MAKAKVVISQPVVETVELTLSKEEAEILKGILGCFIARGITQSIWDALKGADIKSTHAVVAYGGDNSPLGTLVAKPTSEIAYW
jgi:hypothetical protein